MPDPRPRTPGELAEMYRTLAEANPAGPDGLRWRVPWPNPETEDPETEIRP